MNLIQEDTKKEKKKSGQKMATILLVLIILIIILISAIGIYIYYLKSNILTVVIDGQVSEQVKNMLIIEDDGTVYAPIKKIASYLGYSKSYNGEYQGTTNTGNKCYVEGTYEVANFELNSNKIYKELLKSSIVNEQYEYLEQPVKMINNELYTTSEGLEKGFNIVFSYDTKKNKIEIQTLDYLVETWNTNVKENYSYQGLVEDFSDYKAILDGILIVQKDNNQIGAIDLRGNVVLEPKYQSIQYLSTTKDFLVQLNQKVGVLSNTGITKIDIVYDSINLMDYDNELYIVKSNSKYGIIDFNGNRKTFIEYDQIGIDASRFSDNEIKSNYVIAGNLIPIKQNNLWALFDTDGNQLTSFQYESFGCTSSSNKNAKSLLVIPNYNVIVAKRDKKYTLINNYGTELFTPQADEIYMVISGGENNYYILVSDQILDAEKWMDEHSNLLEKRSDDEDSQNSGEEDDSNNSVGDSQNNSENDDDDDEKNETRSGSTNEERVEDEENATQGREQYEDQEFNVDDEYDTYDI